MNTLTTTRPEPMIASAQLAAEQRKETAREKYARLYEQRVAGEQRWKDKQAGIDRQRPHADKALTMTPELFTEILGDNFITKVFSKADIETLRKGQADWDNLNTCLATTSTSATHAEWAAQYSPTRNGAEVQQREMRTLDEIRIQAGERRKVIRTQFLEIARVCGDICQKVVPAVEARAEKYAAELAEKEQRLAAKFALPDMPSSLRIVVIQMPWRVKDAVAMLGELSSLQPKDMLRDLPGYVEIFK